MSVYRVLVDDSQILYEGTNLVEALDAYNQSHGHHIEGRDSEHITLVELGTSESKDRALAEFIGGSRPSRGKE